MHPALSSLPSTEVVCRVIFLLAGEILVNLKGLYIGSYKKLPQIGGVNTKLSDGSLGMGKIERAIWNEHFKILNPGEADASTVVPEEFDLTKLTDAAYMNANVGKLMTLKKVKFASANGTNVWAPDDTNTSLNRSMPKRARESAAATR